MKRVSVWTESDEYVSLRQELLGLLSQSRQILYAAAVFVIVAIGWYLTPATPPAVPLSIFTVFLYGVLDVSAIAYIVNMSQAYRIGGYLAVFWESQNPDMHLFWHRLNRQGPAGGFLSNVAMAVYGGSMVATLSFFITATLMRLAKPGEPISLVLPFGFAHISCVWLLSWYLRRRRNGFEIEWRRIKDSPDAWQAIHTRYEAEPTRIILP